MKRSGMREKAQECSDSNAEAILLERLHGLVHVLAPEQGALSVEGRDLEEGNGGGSQGAGEGLDDTGLL